MKKRVLDFVVLTSICVTAAYLAATLNGFYNFNLLVALLFALPLLVFGFYRFLYLAATALLWVLFQLGYADSRET